MQRSPDTAIGSHAMLTRRFSGGASADLQGSKDTNGRLEKVRISRRPSKAYISGTWAALLTALAVATLLSRCFHLVDKWRKYDDGKRRLASGLPSSEIDPETQAILELCLDLEGIGPQTFPTSLPPVPAATTLEGPLGIEPQTLDQFGVGHRLNRSRQTWQPTPQWGSPSQALVPPFLGTAIVTSTPVTVAAATPVTNSTPFYQVAGRRNMSSQSAVTWADANRLGIGWRRCHQGTAAANIMLETRSLILERPFALHSVQNEPRDVTEPKLSRGLPGRSRTLQADPPEASPSMTPQVSPQVSPCSGLIDMPNPGDDSDPGEGPSSGQSTLLPASVYRGGSWKRKRHSEASPNSSLTTIPTRTPVRRKPRQASSEGHLPSSILLSPLSVEDVKDPQSHLFFRLPRLGGCPIRTRFCQELAFSETKLQTVTYYGILALRSFLSKEAVVSKEVTSAIRTAERLVNCLLHFHSSSVYDLKPNDAVRALGVRYLALDALVALSDLLGQAMHAEDWWGRLAQCIPSDVRFVTNFGAASCRNSNCLLAIKLSKAIEQLKKGVRPCAAETVNLKQCLFCTAFSPSFFQLPKWNPWREDDSLSIKSVDQPQDEYA
ncbi:hypothetical protein, conserved [Eimeria maxima]|uniref:Uncharacterized protein n=1 Tax=Eimeria maxima TaxID=5804 RepID=U6MF78_EIMMA|nr:hypothetical protein, conserved [Eimeria maxima]CDJ60320.1 hypothetical protein, conserved [Eimeria maxima]